MKKILSAIFAMCIVFASGFNAFASEIKTDKVEAQIIGAGEYITKTAGTYGVDNAVEFARLLRSHWADTSAYKEAFIEDVKNNLASNDGRIMVDVYDYATDITVKQECLDTYAAVIASLSMLFVDTTDFEGVNLEALLYAMDTATATANPFNYDIVFDGLAYCKDENTAFVKSVADTYVSTYYVVGSGMNYYGYGCDNDAAFILAMKNANKIVNEYDTYISDATALLDNYKVDGGYCYNKAYSAEPNCNSTALALAALCCDFDKNDNELDRYTSLYQELCAFESATTGVFTYDGAPSIFATRDALTALTYYWNVAAYTDYEMGEDYSDDEEETTENPTVIFTVEKNNDITDDVKKSPYTGIGDAGIALSTALCSALAITMAIKRKTR